MDDLFHGRGNSWGKFGDGSIFGIDEDKMFRATQLLYDYLYMRIQEKKSKKMTITRGLYVTAALKSSLLTIYRDMGSSRDLKRRLN